MVRADRASCILRGGDWPFSVRFEGAEVLSLQEVSIQPVGRANKRATGFCVELLFCGRVGTAAPPNRAFEARAVTTPASSPPAELLDAIHEFWPESEWDNAQNVSLLESGWDAFALNDTTSATSPCGAPIGERQGVAISAERSVGYFQIDSCNFPDWEWQRLYNARHNAGTAHMLWAQRGWSPWYFSAKQLGLV